MLFKVTWDLSSNENTLECMQACCISHHMSRVALNV